MDISFIRLYATAAATTNLKYSRGNFILSRFVEGRQTPRNSNFFFQPVTLVHDSYNKMAQQRLALWNTEEDLEEDVDLSIAIGNYGQNMQYEECEWGFAMTSVSRTYAMDAL